MQQTELSPQYGYLLRSTPCFLLATMLACFSLQSAFGQEESGTDRIYEEVYVTGGREQISTLAGSASLLDEEQILQFDSTDINSLLQQVPGVYLRIEDGYGLRPNIGLRGATSERSQKLTLMEDGILIAPAPYSAPAAYYMPNINRMSAIEVFKGPSAIQHGPHTVGGALNMVTAPTAGEAGGRLEATLGNDSYHKYRAFYGGALGPVNFWIDGLRYGSDGFKELDGGGDTGFERNDINAKLQWSSSADARVDQQLQLKMGYADERSDETYLGLTDEDFGKSPNRRYVGSQLDQFNTEHWQAHLIHNLALPANWRLTTRLYYNQFERAWFKYDGFIDPRAPAAAVVLANPEEFPREIALLRGEVDSDGSDFELLDVTDFDRAFESMGIDLRASHFFSAAGIDHSVDVGLRYHYDYVERDHDVFGYSVEAGTLVFDGEDRDPSLVNEWETDALALFLSDKLEFGNWTVDLGLRYEMIEGDAEDLIAVTREVRDQEVLLPGLGLYYALSDSWGVLAGVHKGFSPASPGAGESVDPEESINYEYGVRYQRGSLTFDLIGFFSDYENLLGRCRVSDVGCEVGEEFNGGEVEVAGAEFTSNYTVQLGTGLWMPISLVYTYTESAFQTSFTSNFSQWNPGHFQGVSLAVREGDELPYTPDHQARLQIGLDSPDWRVSLALKHISEMREVPGRGSYSDGEFTEAYTTIDVAASYTFSSGLTLRVIGENLTDEQVIVSRRPFGARPNISRQLRIGLSYTF
ncbi:MAG: TonB-dependent receptor [Pseudomonadota bacterium]